MLGASSEKRFLSTGRGFYFHVVRFTSELGVFLLHFIESVFSCKHLIHQLKFFYNEFGGAINLNVSLHFIPRLLMLQCWKQHFKYSLLRIGHSKIVNFMNILDFSFNSGLVHII